MTRLRVLQDTTLRLYCFMTSSNLAPATGPHAVSICRPLSVCRLNAPIADVEVRRTSVVEMEMTSLNAIPTNPRFASFSAPWAGPCVPLPLSLIAVGRQALRGPASTEEDREETFPSPESPMADDD